MAFESESRYLLRAQDHDVPARNSEESEQADSDSRVTRDQGVIGTGLWGVPPGPGPGCLGFRQPPSEPEPSYLAASRGIKARAVTAYHGNRHYALWPHWQMYLISKLECGLPVPRDCTVTELEVV